MGGVPAKTRTLSMVGNQYWHAAYFAGPFLVGYLNALHVKCLANPETVGDGSTDINQEINLSNSATTSYRPKVVLSTSNYLISVSDNMCQLFDMSLPNYPCYASIPCTPIKSAAASDNLLFLAPKDAKPIKVINVTEGKVERELRPPIGVVIAKTPFITANNEIVTAAVQPTAGKHRLITWGLHTGEPLYDVPLATAAAFKIYKNEAFYSVYGAAGLQCMDITTGDAVCTIPLKFDATQYGTPLIGQSESGNLVVGLTNSFRIVSPESHSVIYSYSAHSFYGNQFHMFNDNVCMLRFVGKRLEVKVVEVPQQMEEKELPKNKKEEKKAT